MLYTAMVKRGTKIYFDRLIKDCRRVHTRIRQRRRFMVTLGFSISEINKIEGYDK